MSAYSIGKSNRGTRQLTLDKKSDELVPGPGI
jgi:hypothetical protein